jgi:hypothetical protein
VYITCENYVTCDAMHVRGPSMTGFFLYFLGENILVSGVSPTGKCAPFSTSHLTSTKDHPFSTELPILVGQPVLKGL